MCGSWRPAPHPSSSVQVRHTPNLQATVRRVLHRPAGKGDCQPLLTYPTALPPRQRQARRVLPACPGRVCAWAPPCPGAPPCPHQTGLWSWPCVLCAGKGTLPGRWGRSGWNGYLVNYPYLGKSQYCFTSRQYGAQLLHTDRCTVY